MSAIYRFDCISDRSFNSGALIVNDPSITVVWLFDRLFGSGAQRSYITENLKLKLNLQVLRSKRIAVKTFGNTESEL